MNESRVFVPKLITSNIPEKHVENGFPVSSVKLSERSDGMLRHKISIVLVPKVLDDLDSIAKTNNIKATEVMTRLTEELFRKKKLLVEVLADIGIAVDDDFDKPEAIQLPFKTKEIVIPDKCPACGETEDVLGDKVLYETDGMVCCKACYGKFKPEMR